jgi:hypothetical protein
MSFSQDLNCNHIYTQLIECLINTNLKNENNYFIEQSNISLFKPYCCNNILNFKHKLNKKNIIINFDKIVYDTKKPYYFNINEDRTEVIMKQM